MADKKTPMSKIIILSLTTGIFAVSMSHIVNIYVDWRWPGNPARPYISGGITLFILTVIWIAFAIVYMKRNARIDDSDENP